MVDLLVSWVAQAIAELFQAAIEALAPILGFDMSLFNRTFPFAFVAYGIFQRVALGLVLVIAVVHLWPWFFPSDKQSKVSPIRIAFSSILAVVFIFYGNYLFEAIIELCKYPYDALLASDATAMRPIADFEFNGIATAAADAFYAVSIPLYIVILLLIGIAFLKLMVEAIERYCILFMLIYISPLASSTLASPNTTAIFKKFFSMFISQCILVILNIWILKMVISMFDGLGSNPDKILALLLGYAALRIGAKLDSYLNQLGLNAAITGVGLAGEMIGAGMAAIAMGGGGGGGSLGGSGGSAGGILGAGKGAIHGATNFVGKFSPISGAANFVKNTGKSMTDGIKNTNDSIQSGGIIENAISSATGQSGSSPGGSSTPAASNAAAMATGAAGVSAGAAAGAGSGAGAGTAGSGTLSTVAREKNVTHGTGGTNVAAGTGGGSSNTNTGPNVPNLNNLTPNNGASGSGSGASPVGSGGTLVGTRNNPPTPATPPPGVNASASGGSGPSEPASVPSSLDSAFTAEIPAEIAQPAMVAAAADEGDTAPATAGSSEPPKVPPTSVHDEASPTSGGDPAPEVGAAVLVGTSRPKTGIWSGFTAKASEAAKDAVNKTGDSNVWFRALPSYQKGEQQIADPMSGRSTPDAAIAEQNRTQIATRPRMADNAYNAVASSDHTVTNAEDVASVMQGIGADQNNKAASEFIRVGHGTTDAENVNFTMDSQGIHATYTRDNTLHEAEIVNAAQYSSLSAGEQYGFEAFKSGDGKKYYQRYTTSRVTPPVKPAEKPKSQSGGDSPKTSSSHKPSDKTKAKSSDRKPKKTK